MASTFRSAIVLLLVVSLVGCSSLQQLPVGPAAALKGMRTTLLVVGLAVIALSQFSRGLSKLANP
jgi:hypothetical protein